MLNLGRPVLCALLLWIVPVSCSLPGKPASPPMQTFVLQGSGSLPGVPPARARPCLSLRISSPTAAPGVGSARMAYSQEANRLDYFAYHAWVDAPAKMLSSLMTRTLESSGLFGAVVSGSPEVRTQLRLDSELLRLQQEFDGSDSRLLLDVRVALVDVPSRTLLGSRSFSYSITAGAANPEAGVAAANQAADRFVADLEEFLAASIAPISCAGSN